MCMSAPGMSSTSASTEFATKSDLLALKHELLAEIHRTARNLMLSTITVNAVMVGIVFTAVRVS